MMEKPAVLRRHVPLWRGAGGGYGTDGRYNEGYQEVRITMKHEE